MANGDGFGDLIQGGLRDYLDILAYRELSEIDRKPLAQETPIYVKQDGPQAALVGFPSVPTVAGVNALWLIGGGLVVVAIVALLMRRG